MKAWNTFQQNLVKISTKMESRKQLSIIQFFHKNSNSKNEVSGFNKIDEEGRPMTSIVQHGLKRPCDVAWSLVLLLLLTVKKCHFPCA